MASMYEPTVTPDQQFPNSRDRLAPHRSSGLITPGPRAARACAACHQEIPARRDATEKRTAFAVGTILATVPLLFLLTTPGVTQPDLWMRLAICAGGGVAGVLFRRRHRSGWVCPRCAGTTVV